MRRRARRNNNGARKGAGKVLRQVQLVASGVVATKPPADPPSYPIRAWNRATVTLEPGSWSSDKLVQKLAYSIGLIETGAAFTEWDLIEIRLQDIKCWGAVNAGALDQVVSLTVNEIRQLIGEAASPFTRTLFEIQDRAGRMQRARVGARFRLPVLQGANTQTIFKFEGAVAQCTMQWRVTSDFWLQIPANAALTRKNRD